VNALGEDLRVLRVGGELADHGAIRREMVSARRRRRARPLMSSKRTPHGCVANAWPYDSHGHCPGGPRPVTDADAPVAAGPRPGSVCGGIT
jgi:hypothetical protein